MGIIGKWVLAEGLSTSNNQKGVLSAVFTNASGFSWFIFSIMPLTTQLDPIIYDFRIH